MKVSERENKRERSRGKTRNINLPTAVEEKKKTFGTQDSRVPCAFSRDEGSTLFEGKGYRACLFSLQGEKYLSKFAGSQEPQKRERGRRKERERERGKHRAVQTFSDPNRT